jgi:hypothetical protein
MRFSAARAAAACGRRLDTHPIVHGHTADRDGVKSYAFTSLWCAYAAIASVIILAYFWKSRAIRPFAYLETL